MRQPRNVHPLPAELVVPLRRMAGQTRHIDDRSEMWDGSEWVCAEPVENVPEGMCSLSSPCQLHWGQEVT